MGPPKTPPNNKPRKPVNKAPLDSSSIKQIFGLEEEREALPPPAKQKIKIEKIDLLEKKVEKVEKKVEKIEKKVEKVEKKAVETNGLEMPSVVTTPKKEKKKKEDQAK